MCLNLQSPPEGGLYTSVRNLSCHTDSYAPKAVRVERLCAHAFPLRNTWSCGERPLKVEFPRSSIRIALGWCRVDSGLFRVKNIDQLISDADEPERRLKKSLGWLSLTSLGIGAVIGSGIFTVIGTAIAGQKFQASSILNAPLLEFLIHHSASFGRPGAGPAIALSFILVAIACGFASVCYAELAAMIPIAGSAYTYTYATMGELVAWIIGWDLILEYAVSNMAVSVGFSDRKSTRLNS